MTSSTTTYLDLKQNVSSVNQSEGEILSGMHFSSAVSSIQSHVGQIKGVEISYCDKNPLAYDLSIKLSQDGLKLVFDSVSQRLKVIEVYDLSLVRLKYG